MVQLQYRSGSKAKVFGAALEAEFNNGTVPGLSGTWRVLRKGVSSGTFGLASGVCRLGFDGLWGRTQEGARSIYLFIYMYV